MGARSYRWEGVGQTSLGAPFFRHLSRCRDKLFCLDVKVNSYYDAEMAKAKNLDHIGRLLEQRRREMPDVPLDGMAIFARARRLDRLSREWIEPVFARHDLESGEFDVLATLQRAGKPHTLRPTELYQALVISSGGLTDRLGRLVKKGFVERVPSEEDGRSLLVRLTAEGLALIRSAYGEDMAVELELLSELTESERDRLAELLAKLLHSLETRRG